MPSVEEIVAKHRARIKDPAIWFTPNIPPKKLQGAIRSYAQAVSPGDVLMLVDNTVFGGCGDGMLITRDGLYAHYIGGPKAISIQLIKTVNVVDEDLFINGSKFANLLLVDTGGQANHVKICWLVTELASGTVSTPPLVIAQPSGGIVSEVQECLGCGAAVRGLVVCVYCGRRL